MRAIENIPGKFRTQLARHHSEFSNPKNYYVETFPDTGNFNGLMKIWKPRNGYSCSLEMTRLSHRVQGVKPPPTDEIKAAIRLKVNLGSDQLDLYGGLRQLGIKCFAFENVGVDFLVAKMELSRSIFILSMQDADSTLKQLIDVQSGHYMAATAMDESYVYFANPSYADGKSRISKRILEYLWYDLVLATRKIMYGFMIEVPVDNKVLN